MLSSLLCSRRRRRRLFFNRPNSLSFFTHAPSSPSLCLHNPITNPFFPVGKTFKKPRRPFEKERLDAELKLVGEFGLRNKRELWRVQMALSKIRQVRIIFNLISMRGRRAENRGHIGEEGRARKVERK